MQYEIKYVKKTPGEPFPFSEVTVVRVLKEQKIGSEFMLMDGNGRNIRPFNDIGEAMVWIDEERQGI